MKIEKEHVVDEVIGDLKTNKFKISEDSMGIIIDSLINLYSDPIGSIIREVTSNCYDAHREKDLKMKHVIPMTSEDDPKWFHPPQKKPQIEFQEENILLGVGNAFLFRDFGVGLSQRRVEEIYTLFGSSTKRSDNHQIGGFGIGAKSPFSYTDTFYIISSHNGKKFSYMLYRGNDAFHMDLLNTTETIELNSTEIIIPVNTEKAVRDIRNFVKAINNQLAYFTTLEFINIEEGTGQKVKMANLDYESDNIAICLDNGQNFNDMSDIHLMVGRVSYPLNQEMVAREINWSTSTIPIAIKFEIGVLDLVPSREAIRYTDKTKDAIKNKMLEIQKELKIECNDELNRCNNLIDWMKHAHALKQNTNSRYNRTWDSVFAVKSFLAKMKDKDAECTLHDVKLSGSLLDDVYRQERLFRGFSIMQVRKESSANYVGGFKLSKSQVKIEDLTKLPIYFQKQVDPNSDEIKKTFLKSKDFHILTKLACEKFPSTGFIQIRQYYNITEKDIAKEKEINLWNSNEDLRTEEVIKSDFAAMCKLFSNVKMHDYDNVDMRNAEEIGEEIGTFESEAERRKRLGKAFMRRIYFHDQYPTRDRIKFNNDEYFIADLLKYQTEGGVVIYGFSKDAELLKSIAAIHSHAGNYKLVSYYSTNSLDVKAHPVVLLKVAATMGKQLTEFTNVEKLFKMKDPTLTNWYTADLTKERTNKIYFYSMFETLNSDLYYKWRKLFDNHINNYSDMDYLTVIHCDQIRALCQENNCINQKMLTELNELELYSKELELFKHLEFAQLNDKNKRDIPSKEVFLALREYLRFKDKAVVKFKKQKKKKVKSLVSN